MNLLIWFIGISVTYILIGAFVRAYFSRIEVVYLDEDGSLLKQAETDHEVLPMLLVLTWPIFLVKWFIN
jgi:hypothetical protein